MFLALREVDDQLAVFLQDHPPEVFLGGRQWALGGDECLVVDLQHRIDIICIYI
jgi:hypothetical protein